jgi:hypothetical protein
MLARPPPPPPIPALSQMNSAHTLPPPSLVLFKIIFNFIFPSTLISSYRTLQVLLPKLYMHPLPLCAAFHAYLILLVLTIPILVDLWSSSSFTHSFSCLMLLYRSWVQIFSSAHSSQVLSIYILPLILETEFQSYTKLCMSTEHNFFIIVTLTGWDIWPLFRWPSISSEESCSLSYVWNTGRCWDCRLCYCCQNQL